MKASAYALPPIQSVDSNACMVQFEGARQKQSPALVAAIFSKASHHILEVMNTSLRSAILAFQAESKASPIAGSLP